MAKISVIEPKKSPFKTKKRVAAYARVSAETDNLAHSLSVQISYYNDFIQKNKDWEFAGVYADRFVTGTSTKHRYEFQRMLADAKAGKIDIILTKSVSRFARNTVDLLETVRTLKEIGVEVRFEKENLSTFTADGELILTLLAAFAEEESKSISENIKWIVKKKYEKGIPHTRQKMLGYRWDGDELVIKEYEAKIVKWIFEEYVKGDRSYIFLANELKKQGFIGLRGKPLSVPGIKRILLNEQYTGSMLFHKEYNYAPKKERYNRGEKPMYRIENHHEPIISEELFQKAQIVMKKRAKDYDKHSEECACLSGKLVCGECGYMMAPHSNYSRVNRIKRYTFGCNNRHINGREACDNPWFSKSLMDKACSDVLGTDDYETAFEEKIKELKIFKNHFEFFFKDGKKMKWQKGE